MYSDAKKLHIIEEILKIKSEATLSALQRVLKKSQSDDTPLKTHSLNDFFGIWSKDEAEEMERIIAESCENIHPDDWK